MSNRKELERIGGLFSLASEKHRPFLDRCSETKYLAVRDFGQATSIVVELARQTLQEANGRLLRQDEFKKYINVLQNALESGHLDSGLIKTLENLRSKYLAYKNQFCNAPTIEIETRVNFQLGLAPNSSFPS